MHCVIIIPCYNEAERLPVSTFESFARKNSSVSFQLVDDGSTDNTRGILESLKDSNRERFSVLSIRHGGKAEAVRQGILRALECFPDYVGFWDADLSTPLEPILDFCDVLEKNSCLHMIFGSRVKLLGRRIERQVLRHYLGRVFATAVSIMLNLAIYDTQCGAKVFRASSEVRALFDRPFRTKWVFDVELLARLRQRQKIHPETAIYEFPLTQWRHTRGSKVKLFDFVLAFADLLKIYQGYLRPKVRSK